MAKKANVVYIENANPLHLSIALKYFCSNEPNILNNFEMDSSKLGERKQQNSIKDHRKNLQFCFQESIWAFCYNR